MARIRTAMAVLRTLQSLRRSHLSEMRTGIGIITIALSILTILITTSNLYSIPDVFLLLSALITIDAILVVFGSHLVIKALKEIRRIERREKAIDFGLDDISTVFRMLFKKH